MLNTFLSYGSQPFGQTASICGLPENSIGFFAVGPIGNLFPIPAPDRTRGVALLREASNCAAAGQIVNPYGALPGFRNGFDRDLMPIRRDAGTPVDCRRHIE